jgi:acyl carrier protein
MGQIALRPARSASADIGRNRTVMDRETGVRAAVRTFARYIVRSPGACPHQPVLVKCKSGQNLQALPPAKLDDHWNGTISMALRGIPVDRQGIEDWLVAQIASMQRMSPEEVDVDESFIANGLSSRSSVALIGDLAKVLGVTLPETLTWEYPTIAALAQHVAGIGACPHED